MNMVQVRKLTSAEDLGVKICEALGIDHSSVRRVTVEVIAGNPIPYIEVTMIDLNDQLCAVDWSNLEQVQLSRTSEK
jgi:hypothetical protein